MQNRTHSPLRVGVFRRLSQADRAVDALARAGFPADNISVVCPECSRDAFHQDVEVTEPAGARTPRAALTGGALGAVLGGAAAGVGLASTGGALLVLGPLLGAASAGAVTGGFVGAMTQRGLEPEIADDYDRFLSRGRILVAVDTEAHDATVAKPSPRRAEKIFEECGAEPIALPKG